jgi:hypothetical protein
MNDNPRFDVAALDALSDRNGFVNRAIEEPLPKRTRGVAARVFNFSMRILVSDAIAYCERERLTYRKALASGRFA